MGGTSNDKKRNLAKRANISERLPAFVSLIRDREGPRGGYRSTSDVLKNKALKEHLLATARIELQGWLKRYKMLTALAGAVAEAAGIDLTKIDAQPKRKAK